MSPPHAADMEYLVRQAMSTGYQWSSLIAPPAYVAYILARKGHAELSINRILRATWIGGLGGASISGGGAYVRYAYSRQEFVRDKRMETAYNTSIVRRNDHSTIGSVLGAVAVPAILWKHANIVNLILGGAGLGGGIGLLTHYGRTLSEDPHPKVDIVLPVAPADKSQPT
ncbi:hypothetical protein HYPSUDRAFT_205284 [Hypholoma sublateritium FD-334 SS-4]|uniref:Uncharacterized protein n=1 Tax=Hypholoma sublateritium (strain FD-334 SS-4) TaxID=945553 RepID=A0A0D2KVC6_HYPSF|nr:hypothetical protein HYPSUDRAFT_205284 [Hypholoma sublateritium FD-334 SS-4]